MAFLTIFRDFTIFVDFRRHYCRVGPEMSENVEKSLKMTRFRGFCSGLHHPGVITPKIHHFGQNPQKWQENRHLRNPTPLGWGFEGAGIPSLVCLNTLAKPQKPPPGMHQDGAPTLTKAPWRRLCEGCAILAPSCPVYPRILAKLAKPLRRCAVPSQRRHCGAFVSVSVIFRNFSQNHQIQRPRSLGSGQIPKKPQKSKKSVKMLETAPKPTPLGWVWVLRWLGDEVTGQARHPHATMVH